MYMPRLQRFTVVSGALSHDSFIRDCTAFVKGNTNQDPLEIGPDPDVMPEDHLTEEYGYSTGSRDIPITIDDSDSDWSSNLAVHDEDPDHWMSDNSDPLSEDGEDEEDDDSNDRSDDDSDNDGSDDDDSDDDESSDGMDTS